MIMFAFFFTKMIDVFIQVLSYRPEFIDLPVLVDFLASF